MSTVASRELRNRTRQVLERVEAGEDVFITVDGREVARVTQVSRKPRWVPRGAFLADLRRVQADAGLRADLDELAPDTTDDLGPL
ncbi:MAG: type II toxin-antitoxin system prevent-host-death family antitoxin [Trueperaceae bacterium]|nr:type II toxin-antitoxin system prevent-host-death family antitoxin [Trueperaceae bacterium]